MSAFTDRFIAGLKPGETRYDRIEGRGFSVRVFPSGVKTFQLRYMLNGQTRRISLGNYPGMTLAAAREKLEMYRGCLGRGIDPVEHQAEQGRLAAQAAAVQEEAARLEANSHTVAGLVEIYLEKWAKPRKRTWQEDARMLQKDVIPVWGIRKAKEITRRDVVGLLAGMMARGATVTTNRTLAVVRRMFNY
ncbi:MAG: Arm DNA-binding domain-containing protein, partial [Magnetococcus sp. MYC-9]